MLDWKIPWPSFWPRRQVCHRNKAEALRYLDCGSSAIVDWLNPVTVYPVINQKRICFMQRMWRSSRVQTSICYKSPWKNGAVNWIFQRDLIWISYGKYSSQGGTASIVGPKEPCGGTLLTKLTVPCKNILAGLAITSVWNVMGFVLFCFMFMFV